MLSTTHKTVSVCSLQFLLACGACVWFLMFLVTRLHIFHEAYTHEVKMRDTVSSPNVRLSSTLNLLITF